MEVIIIHWVLYKKQGLRLATCFPVVGMSNHFRYQHALSAKILCVIYLNYHTKKGYGVLYSNPNTNEWKLL